MPEISIVMAYRNRPQQLELTLKSIRRQGIDVEIIIVDDGSILTEKADNVARKFPELDITVLYISEKERFWINPCVPFNVGIQKTKGDFIVLQSPECLHIGNVLEFSRRNISSGKYLCFSCYNLPKMSHGILHDFLSLSDSNLDEQIRVLVPLEDSSTDLNTRRGDGCWFNHPVYCPKNYHFLSVMSRENLEDLGGFDERYAEGYCWDDNEFLWRVRQKGLLVETVPPISGFVVHQWHSKGPVSGTCPEWYRNKNLFETVTKRSSTYKVNQ